MIRNEAEYQEASARLADERQRLTEHRARLAEAGLGEEEIKRVIDPMESFHLQLKRSEREFDREGILGGFHDSAHGDKFEVADGKPLGLE